MKTAVTLFPRWISLLVLFGAITVAIPVPVLDVADLAERADLIAVGQIVSVTQENSQTVDIDGVPTPVHMTAGTMRVDQILKGTIDSSQLRFEFVLPDAPLGYGGVSPGTYRIVFFKKARAGYSFVSPYYPSCVATPGVPRREAGLLENVSYQLEAVLLAPGTQVAQKEEALHELRTLRTPTATHALVRALQEKTTDLQLTAVAALLERNDLSGMQIAEVALTARPPTIPSYLLHNIAYAISQGVRDDRAVPMLKRLLRVPDTETRRAAASGLWHTGSSAAAPALAAALNDGDFEVRYYGVIGLAEIAGQREWHPNMDVFRSEEARYLEHWRDWARTNYPSQKDQ